MEGLHTSGKGERTPGKSVNYVVVFFTNKDVYGFSPSYLKFQLPTLSLLPINVLLFFSP